MTRTAWGRRAAGVLVAVAVAVAGFGTGADAQSDKAAKRAELDAKADAALAQLDAEDPAAKTLGAEAEGLLIFPRIFEGGLIIGGLTGDGVLRVGGETVGYDDTTAVTLGLQAGGQVFSQVLMFLDPAALKTFQTSKGCRASTSVAAGGNQDGRC